MKSRQLIFFSVLEDVEKIFRDIEVAKDIRYYKIGLHDSSNIPTYDSVFDIPNIGFTSSGDWNKIDRFLIMKKNIPLKISKVIQVKGEPKFAVDQSMNDKSIELKLGGIYSEKESVLVAGRVSTISEEEDSNELYILFTKKIKKEFRKIDVCYVGKIAEEKLKSGWRLVVNEKSPKEYDLAFK